MGEDAIRDAQPAHIRVLRRRDVKQSVVAPAEVVGWLGRFVLVGLVLEPGIGVERVLLALELFLLRELAAAGNRLVLRQQMLGVGARRNARRGFARAARRARDLEAGGEPLQIALLLWREVPGHGRLTPLRR